MDATFDDDSCYMAHCTVASMLVCSTIYRTWIDLDESVVTATMAS